MRVSTGELADINLRLQETLEVFKNEANHPIQPETLNHLLQTLLAGAELLQSSRITALDPVEVRDYRNLLLSLTSLLPDLEARLRTERAHLEAKRSHLNAAAAWTEASKSTLPKR